MPPKPIRRAVLLHEGEPRPEHHVEIHEGEVLGGGSHSLVQRGSHQGKPVIVRRPENRGNVLTLIKSQTLNEHLRKHGFPVPEMNALALVEGVSGPSRLAHVMTDLTEGGSLDAITMFDDRWELMPSAKLSPDVERFRQEALRHRDRARRMGLEFRGPEFMLIRDPETKKPLRIAITDTKAVDGEGEHWERVMERYVPLYSRIWGKLR